MENRYGISQLVGKTLVSVEKMAHDHLMFVSNDGARYSMEHSQDCCESVTIEDIVGDLQDLVGSPILIAREDTNYTGEDRGDESHTWTFYNLATLKGYVNIRWYGSSNGWYSEGVDFVRTKDADLLQA